MTELINSESSLDNSFNHSFQATTLVAKPPTDSPTPLFPAPAIVLE